MDICRILCVNPFSVQEKPLLPLSCTDIRPEALEALKHSAFTLKNVSVIGRRGALQSAFTLKELRELSELSHISKSSSAVTTSWKTEIHTKQGDIQRSLEIKAIEHPSSETPLGLNEISYMKDRSVQRKFEFLKQVSTSSDPSLDKASDQAPSSIITRQINFLYFLSPVRFESDTEYPDQVAAVICRT